jgi:hypothetical protein
MIFQNFVKGGTERVNYGLYEYPLGADIIFDFGNPICTTAFNSSKIVYNVGSVNVTGSLIPYANPGDFYPTLTTDYGGTVLFKRQAGAGTNYLEWNWKSTQNQTSVFVYRPNDTSGNSGEMGFPGIGAVTASANSIYVNINSALNLYGGAYNSSNTQFDDLFPLTVLQTGSVANRNDWNGITYTSNGDSSHNLYLNLSAPITNTTTITRVTSASQSFKFPFRSGFTEDNFSSRIMAYLQYPFILTPKQIRQLYKCFDQRFWL